MSYCKVYHDHLGHDHFFLKPWQNKKYHTFVGMLQKWQVFFATFYALKVSYIWNVLLESSKLPKNQPLYIAQWSTLVLEALFNWGRHMPQTFKKEKLLILS